MIVKTIYRLSPGEGGGGGGNKGVMAGGGGGGGGGFGNKGLMQGEVRPTRVCFSGFCFK